MGKTFRGLIAFGLGAVLQGGLIGAALAQSTSSPPSAPPYGPAEVVQTVEPVSETAPSDELPVLYVTSVEVLRTTIEPKLDIVRVTGLTGSAGWSEPLLVPTFAGKPADDILDLQFIATMPEVSEKAEGFIPISAIFPLEQGHPFKGVRVHASENAIEVTQLPGSSQVTIKVNGCEACVGKKFIEKGQAQSGQQGTVRQEDLPEVLRLISPSRGIRGITQNPNRLTLILGRDNTIVAAFWE